MPKLQNQLPKKCRDRNQCFSWHNGKRSYHGVWASPEAEESYKRFITALLESPPQLLRDVGNSGEAGNEANILVAELCDAFLQHLEPRLAETEYQVVQRAVGFLVELYGSMSVDDITPKKLRTVRDQMMRTGTLCRKTINKLVSKLVRAFVWGSRWLHTKNGGANVPPL